MLVDAIEGEQIDAVLKEKGTGKGGKGKSKSKNSAGDCLPKAAGSRIVSRFLSSARRRPQTAVVTSRNRAPRAAALRA
eukprot:11176890-Heterocapsa_arctica.AAC.1